LNPDGSGSSILTIRYTIYDIIISYVLYTVGRWPSSKFFRHRLHGFISYVVFRIAHVAKGMCCILFGKDFLQFWACDIFNRRGR
jgi:hypothetical protein